MTTSPQHTVHYSDGQEGELALGWWVTIYMDPPQTYGPYEDEDDRDALRHAYRAAGLPNPLSPVYSILGRFKGQQVSATVHTDDGVEAAVDLAQDTWGEELGIPLTESVEVLAVAVGEVDWVDAPRCVVHTYTVVGRYGEGQTWIETLSAPEPGGVPALARRVCAEQTEVAEEALDLEIVAIFEGEPSVVVRGDEAVLIDSPTEGGSGACGHDHAR